MHILICDDDAVFAARVETLVRDFFALRGLQVECTVCHSGEETLARRDLDLYQVALLDVDLDTMNGISLGKQLRQCSPEICLVYVSAYLEFAPEGYTVNAFRYILKRDLDCQLPRCLDAILHEQDHRAPKTLTIRQNRTETELPYGQHLLPRKRPAQDQRLRRCGSSAPMLLLWQAERAAADPV